MSMVARMKEQFKGTGGVTPEQHKVIAKSQKEKEEQAVLIAKARAARYNLTLRTNEIQAAATATPSEGDKVAAMKAASRPDPSKIVKGTTADDYKNKKASAATVEVAADAKPNPFKVNLRKVAPPAKVAEALHHNRDPAVAKALVEVAAQAAVEGVAPVAVEEPKKTEVVLEAKTEKNEAVVVEVKQEVAAVLVEAKVAVTVDVVETIKTEDAPSVVGQEFEMNDLKAAVESGDQAKINQAVVTDFLETHAPELVPEVPALLKEYKGNEAALMEKLAEEHPDPAEKIEAEAVAIITGEVKPSAEEKKEIEEVHKEEEARTAALTDAERAKEEVVKEALEEHAAAQDASLKEELETLREAVKEGETAAAADTTAAAAATEEAPTGGFIFSGVNTDGQWQVNVEETAAAE